MKKEDRKTNPNGINQYTEPDPRQIEFLKNYFNSKSETFGNLTASGIKAGYSEDYSKNLLSKMPNWLLKKVDKLKDSNLIEKAERNLQIFLDGEDEKIKADISKFVLTRLNKEKYSERTELTGKGGKALKIQWNEDNNNKLHPKGMGEETSSE